jgi:hypothetical protein
MGRSTHCEDNGSQIDMFETRSRCEHNVLVDLVDDTSDLRAIHAAITLRGDMERGSGVLAEPTKE